MRLTCVYLQMLAGAISLWAMIMPGAAAGAGLLLSNEHIVASFDANGLAAITDCAAKESLGFANDSFKITVGKETLARESLGKPVVTQIQNQIEYRYAAGNNGVKVIYELRPGWRFVSKQLVFASREPEFRVGDVTVFSAEVRTPIAEEQPLYRALYGVCLRLGGAPPAPAPKWGCFVLLQNPFMKWTRNGQAIGATYTADMDWKTNYGMFASDRCCIGTYALSGTRFPYTMVGEWEYRADPTAARTGEPWMDIAETESVIDCVRNFLLVKPTKSVRVHVSWCENDYQIDAGTADGRAEYKRIIDRAAEMGATHCFYSPSNTELAPGPNADAWGWERTLWLNLGQKIRKGEWDPAKDKIPDMVQEMLDYAKKRNVKLIAYSYPTLGFMQNPEWTAWCDNRPGGYSGVDTGVRSFQDWFVDKLVTFGKKTGLGGYSFDHWWIAYEGKSTSKYTQWYGCRRILESLRTALPDVVIDGRQQVHHFGPWTWLAGSYPHPMGSDEQPGSFRPFSDLHTDRVNGDRQRYQAWWYRMTRFCPTEILPGFITHQTQRSDATGKHRDDQFRTRDWDVLGFKYSLLSSIATAPMNHVINMIPARDLEEFKLMPKEDMQWFRDWLDWTDKNMKYLRNVRPIIGQPMIGCVDGTAAIVGDRGFIFLFNPNYRALRAVFKLDQSIRLTTGRAFTLKELYPQGSRIIGKPDQGFWQYGDTVDIAMGGAQAMVLELVPAEATQAAPVLFNAPGTVALAGGTLQIANASGEMGSRMNMLVALPKDAKVDAVTVNSRATTFKRTGDVVSVPVQFAGVKFSQCQPVGVYDPKFTGGKFDAQFAIPSRVFAQLEARRTRWPVTYTEDDLLAPWVASHRLLLFVNIANPNDEMNVAMKIDGAEVKVQKAYNGIYEKGPRHSFLGFFVDISNLRPDVRHTVEMTVPTLAAGQFQGLFFENIENVYTRDIAAAAAK